MTTGLLEPILDGGIQHTNFFNGRLLAAEDLQAEQQAQFREHGQLGAGIGQGIVRGLQVHVRRTGADGGDAVVRISSGLALTAAGRTLALASDTDLTLTRQADAVSPEAGLFGDCPTDRIATIPTGTGVYLLLMVPAAGYQGNAPMSGLGSSGAISGCGRRSVVTGVRFRLLKIDLTVLPAVDDAARGELIALMDRTDPGADSLLRNRLAHLCFGSGELTLATVETPFQWIGDDTATLAYGALEALALRGDLSDCDIPLALVYWTANGIRFVDEWSVRRPLLPPEGREAWQVFLGARRRTEATAMLNQFQDQLAWLESQVGDLSQMRAADYFRYLPPAGILPFGPDPESGALPFFARSRPPLFIEGAAARALLQSALQYPPLDLLADQGVMVWTYMVRENWMQQGRSGVGVPPYLIFSSGQVPYQGAARFDVARLDYSSFVPATAL